MEKFFAVVIGGTGGPAPAGSTGSYQPVSLLANGFLTIGTNAGGTFIPNDQQPEGAPIVISNVHALGSGCKGGGVEGEQLFPQWARVVPQRGKPLGTTAFDDVYRNRTTWHEGYETEVSSIIEGVVIASHISAIDLPFNHSVDPPSERPRVRHDWNLFLAPDEQYQGMLTDANLLAGGHMEIEWEQSPSQFSLDSLPAIGDRVAVRGRWIYDCGHPPYKTEIHAPNAIAVVRGQTGVVRFSNEGGPTWYQPDDNNLDATALGQKCDATDNLKTVFGFQGGVFSNFSAKVRDALWLGGTCKRTIDIARVAPPPSGPEPTTSPTCYYPQNRKIGDMFPGLPPPSLMGLSWLSAPPTPPGGSAPDWSAPLTFTVPLASTQIPAPNEAGGFDTSTFEMPGRAHTVEYSPTPSPHFRVTVQPSDMPTGLPNLPVHSTDLFGLSTKSEPEFQNRAFEVKVEKTSRARYDNFKLPDWTYLTAVVHPALPFGIWAYCETDDDPEVVMYVMANDQTGRFPKTGGPVVLTTTMRSSKEILEIRTFGFECDLSCGERWDDPEFDNAADDRIGVVMASFNAANNFGAPTDPVTNQPLIGTAASYTIQSQPDLSTARSRVQTSGDYTATIKIAELLVGSPP